MLRLSYSLWTRLNIMSSTIFQSRTLFFYRSSSLKLLSWYYEIYYHYEYNFHTTSHYVFSITKRGVVAHVVEHNLLSTLSFNLSSNIIYKSILGKQLTERFSSRVHSIIYKLNSLLTNKMVQRNPREMIKRAAVKYVK